MAVSDSRILRFSAATVYGPVSAALARTRIVSHLSPLRFILALARLCGFFVSALRNLKNKASSTLKLETEYCAPEKRVTNFSSSK